MCSMLHEDVSTHPLHLGKFKFPPKHEITTWRNHLRWWESPSGIEMKSNKWKILHKHKRQCVWMGPQGRGTRPAGITSLICEFAGMDSVVRLHGGLPPDAAFPIAGATFQLADGGSICVDDPSLASPCLSILTHTFPHLTRTLQHCFRYRRITTGARKPTSNVHGIAWSKSHETAACVITIISCI